MTIDQRPRSVNHLDDFGLSEDGIIAVLKTGGDWCHLNAVSRLGENRHYDTGDQRFAPENIIVSSRELSIVFIVDRRTGEIVREYISCRTLKNFTAGWTRSVSI